MSRVTDWLLPQRLESTILGLVALCTVVVHVIEGWSWVVSITTEGYGDLVFRQDGTKLFLAVYLPVGIGVGSTVLSSIGATILEANRRRLERHHEGMGAHSGHGPSP